MSMGANVGVVVATLFLVAVMTVMILLRSRRLQKRRAARGQATSGPDSGAITVMVDELTSTPTSGPKPSNNAQRLLDPEAAQLGEAANPPQLAGTLHKRSPVSGLYKKVKVSHTKPNPNPNPTDYLLLTTHYPLLTAHY